jgi:hypothetical protein
MEALRLDLIIVYALLPIPSAYAVWHLGRMLTPWPPPKDVLVAALGGALWWWGLVLFSYSRTVRNIGDWDLAVLLVGVSLMILPKLAEMARKRLR